MNRGARAWPLGLSSEALLLACSVYWAAAANFGFLAAVLGGRSAADASTWALGAALFAALASLHFLVAAAITPRVLLKPVLALLALAAALAAYYQRHYGVVLDPAMLRNVLHTDWHEARELLALSMLPWLVALAGPPLALLAASAPRVRPLGAALAWRAGSIVAAVGVLVAALFVAYPSLAPLVRNRHEVRYLVTPANLLWSFAAAAHGGARDLARPKTAIGTDARAGPRWAAATRPVVVVLVVGETARAANWGLGGYARATTPELARLPVINFSDVTSCGTATETALPCMFAPVGRRDYDEQRIDASESLLQVVARAGVEVRWRDNQSGCKGLCEGIAYETVAGLDPPGLCAGGRCFDAGLLAGFAALLERARGVNLVVLHPIGNHGPSYFRRYPRSFEHFRPACRDDDLRRCTREEIVNAYDNALRYTDHVLASLVRMLQAHAATVASALVYVSDHGESLGENRLYLHGLPYAIAPREQLHVPMVLWTSDGFAAWNGLDRGCLERRAAKPASHDHLFHTLVGLLDVRTALYEPGWDLAGDCRRAAPAAVAAR